LITPSINQTSTYGCTGYGDMVVDRTYNRIYIVYSISNFKVSSTLYSYKECNRFIVYTWKNFTDNSTAWEINTQNNICSSTNGGYAQSIYKNHNSVD